MSDTGTGPIDALRRLTATLIDLLRIRLELVGVEVEAHTRSLLTRLWLGLATLALATFGVGFTGLTVILYFWDTHRVRAGAAVGLCFLGAAGVLGVIRHRQLARQPRLFASTTQELSRDVEALRDPGA
jgi:uncharacterized membrane protein YqjE